LQVHLSLALAEAERSDLPDIIINLEKCGHKTPKADIALEALKYISLVFSSLFMLELLASIWAFGRS
jgi:hypothetical protein